MKTLTLWLFMLFTMSGFASAEPPAATKLKVLVLTGGHGFKAEPLAKLFNDDPEITTTFAHHTLTNKSEAPVADAYDREDLSSYDVVVLYDAPREITDAQKARFLAMFDKGVGVIVLHHAYLAHPMWAEYERIAGGKYVYLAEQMVNGIKSSDYTRDMVDIPVTIAAKDHPTTAGLKDFVLHDELYTNMHMVGNVTPLLKTGDELVAWTRQEKRSRVVGTILGHGPSAYEDPNFRRFLWQSIRWVAQGRPTNETPKR
jgi:uncharacterized protein